MYARYKYENFRELMLSLAIQVSYLLRQQFTLAEWNRKSDKSCCCFLQGRLSQCGIYKSVQNLYKILFCWNGSAKLREKGFSG